MKTPKPIRQYRLARVQIADTLHTHPESPTSIQIPSNRLKNHFGGFLKWCHKCDSSAPGHIPSI